MVRERRSKEVTCEKRPEGNKGSESKKRGNPGARLRNCKGPEARECLVCLGDSRGRNRGSKDSNTVGPRSHCKSSGFYCGREEGTEVGRVSRALT